MLSQSCAPDIYAVLKVSQLRDQRRAWQAPHANVYTCAIYTKENFVVLSLIASIYSHAQESNNGRKDSRHVRNIQHFIRHFHNQDVRCGSAQYRG